MGISNRDRITTRHYPEYRIFARYRHAIYLLDSVLKHSTVSVTNELSVLPPSSSIISTANKIVSIKNNRLFKIEALNPFQNRSNELICQHFNRLFLLDGQFKFVLQLKPRFVHFLMVTADYLVVI